MLHLIIITMTDIHSQLTLQTWMSAAFPTGAFTCSHGMETAISDGRISNASDCEDWISGIMLYGSGWNDAVLIANTYSSVMTDREVRDALHTETCKDEHWHALKYALNELNELALALCTGAERLRETTQLGHAFSKAVDATSSQSSPLALLHGDISLPVSIGVNGAIADIPAEQLIPASLQATSSNLVWIATRLIPLGQTQALKIISSLQPLMERIATAALQSTLDDLGTCALLADLASIEHEQLHSRICIT